MDKRLIEIQKMLGASHILISFSGRFSQGIIQELGEAIKEHMENEDKPKNKIFNVFSIFIEQTQNINNYFGSKKNNSMSETIAGSAIVCIGKSEEDYFIWSGNLVENSDVRSLSDQLSLVRSSNKDELKKLYKEQMKKDVQPGQNGAGMGLIDIARKSSLPIEYSFEEIDKSFSFYELKVIV
ncbi:MAG: SiaB family protein kinase [Desulfosporosinus sp.]|nr:SiaB family protein kinase [Desulfosporosinus sp.]